MQLEFSTLATTVDEIRELMQHCILHNFEGRINLTFDSNGLVEVWQPKNVPVAESVEPVNDSNGH